MEGECIAGPFWSYDDYIVPWGHSFGCRGCQADSCVRIVRKGTPFPGPRGRDDYANVRLVAPQGFSLGSHVVPRGGLESHTAGGLKQAAGSESGRTVFPVFLHNSGLKSFLCDYSVRALGSHGYSLVVGQLPGLVSLGLWP